MKHLKRIFYFFAMAYVLLCAVLFFAQDKIIFNPYKLDEDFVFRTGEELEVEVEDGVSLNCLLIREPQSKGVILYLHGNKGSIRRCIRQAENMTGNGYDIFIPDYRGYGKSDGEIESEAQLQTDVQKVYDFLKQQYDEDQIVLVGYSLGSGLASYLAAQNQPQKLVMVAPYLSLLDIKNRVAPFLPDFLLRYPMQSEIYLRQVTAPVTLFHGNRDEIIPFDSSQKLQSINPGKIKLVAMDSGHRGVLFQEDFREGIQQLLR
jgi:alpha-beta hydrolase superfamily lysophospholipase